MGRSQFCEHDPWELLEEAYGERCPKCNRLLPWDNQGAWKPGPPKDDEYAIVVCTDATRSVELNPCLVQRIGNRVEELDRDCARGIEWVLRHFPVVHTQG